MESQSKGPPRGRAGCPAGAPVGSGGGSSLSQRIGSALLYAVASFGITIVNKEVLTVHKFPSFQCLAWGQMVATVLILYTAKNVRLLSFPDLQKSTFEKIWPLPLLFLGNVIFGLASTKKLSLPMFTALRRFAILLTMVAEFFILGIKPSTKVQVAVYMMIFGAIVAACDDFSFTAEGYVFVFLTNIFNAMQGVYVKKKLDAKELGTYGLAHYNSFFVLIPTFFIALSMGEVDAARKYEGWLNPVFILLFLLSCVMGLLLTYSTFKCTEHNSALTTTIVGSLKNVTVTYLGMAVGGDYVFSVVNFIGLNASIVGSLLYTWVVFGEKPKSTNSGNEQDKPDPEVPSLEKSHEEKCRIAGKLHEKNEKSRRDFDIETLRLSAIVTLVLLTMSFVFLMSESGVQRRISDFPPGTAQRSKLLFEHFRPGANVTHTPKTAAIQKTTHRSDSEIELFTNLSVVEERTQSSFQISEKTLGMTTRSFENSPPFQNTRKTTGEDTTKEENGPSTQKMEVTTVANLVTFTNSHETKLPTKLTTVKESPTKTTPKEFRQPSVFSKKTVVDNVTHSYYQTMQKLARAEEYFSKNFSYLQDTSIHKDVVPVKGFEISFKDIHEANDPRLFNMTDFKYIINKEDFCPPGPETPFVIVLVHSAIQNLDKRNGIRQSWGLDVPVLFFMGATADAAAQRQLLEEDAHYHDLVQGSFMDTYHNLTYKHAMVLKWTVSFCPRVKYLVKMDDDSFLNVPYLMGTLHDLSGTGVLNLMACMVYFNSAVLRYSKWAVSREEYAPDHYPNYCNGWIIIYSPDVALRLYKESFKHKYFWIDDVFITGILAKPLGIMQSDISSTILGEDYVDPQKTHILAGLPLDGKKIIKMTKHYDNYTSSLLKQINNV